MITSELATHFQRDALPPGLVDQRQDLQLPTVLGPIEDEVDRPDMIWMLSLANMAKLIFASFCKVWLFLVLIVSKPLPHETRH